MTDARAAAHGQASYDVRVDWGPTGGAAVAAGADVAVVVDVLSFTTTLGIAVGQGTRVFPFRWKDERAADFAAARDAVRAVGRFEAAGLDDRVERGGADEGAGESGDHLNPSGRACPACTSGWRGP